MHEKYSVDTFKRQFITLLLCLLIIILASCGPYSTERTVSPAINSTPLATVSTLTATVTSTPTNTPTKTALPTITRTPLWPLTAFTPLPPDLARISVENSSQIKLIAFLQYEQLISTSDHQKPNGEIHALDGVFTSNNRSLIISNIIVPENSNERPEEKWIYQIFTGEVHIGNNISFDPATRWNPTSPDGNYLATCKNDYIILIDKSGAERQLGRSICNHLAGLAFSADSSLIAQSNGYGNLRIWQVQDGKKLLDAEANCFQGDVEFSPDGQFLLTTCDAYVRMWRLSDGEVLRFISDSRLKRGLNGVAISPDQTMIASFYDGGVVGLWAIGEPTLSQKALLATPTPITDIVPISQPIRFVYPGDGQILGYSGSYLFKITAVDGAEGYLWSFYQNGQMVWENLRNEGKLSGIEYGIGEYSAAHTNFSLGDLTVIVRARVNGGWSKPTSITIKLR